MEGREGGKGEGEGKNGRYDEMHIPVYLIYPFIILYIITKPVHRIRAPELLKLVDGLPLIPSRTIAYAPSDL